MPWDEFHEIERNATDYEFIESFEESNLSLNDIIFIKINRLLSDPSFEEILKSKFIDKVRDRKFSVIRNEKTGKYCIVLNSVRGNSAYSKKKFKRIKPIVDAFGNKRFSHSVKGSRESERLFVNAVLITLSFARYDSKQELTSQNFPVQRMLAYNAWDSITELVNQFKVELARIIRKEQKRIGTYEAGKAGYVSCLIKEGCNDSYPAPHLIVIFDKPILAHRWGKQWLLGSSAHDRGLVNSIQGAWERIAGAYCKINAIVTTKGFAYVFKYIMKSIDLSCTDFSDMIKEQRVCLNTHFNQALHNQRDMIGKKFLEKLEYFKEESLLDITSNELKQVNRQVNRLESEILENGGFNVFTFFEYPHLNEYWELKKERDRLRKEAYDLKMELSPWFYVSGGFSSVESAMSSLDLTFEDLKM